MGKVHFRQRCTKFSIGRGGQSSVEGGVGKFSTGRVWVKFSNGRVWVNFNIGRGGQSSV